MNMKLFKECISIARSAGFYGEAAILTGKKLYDETMQSRKPTTANDAERK